MTQNTQNSFRKFKNAGGITLPSFKIYSIAVVVERVWYWQTNRSIEQNPESKIDSK